MKINFKKIASVLASTVMLTSTIGFAAAGTYPAPFSSTGGAVVYGASAAKMDVVAAYKVENSVKGSSTTTTTSTTGETTPLFTGSTKLYVNDSINTVKQILTKADLPTVLARGSFSGNVDATYEQSIVLGTNPTVKYQNAPTSSDPLTYAMITSFSTNSYIYNSTVTFSKAIAFNNSDSKNQELVLFGQKFTVGAGTDSSNLVLFKSASKLSFDSTGTTSGEVTINGKKYTIELVSASGSGATATATIQVTGEDGTSEQKDITVGNSKKVNGVSIAVNTASSNNQKYIASVIAGAEKITIPATSGSVTTGDSATPIDGTSASVIGGTGAATGITISVAAKGSDYASILQGQSFTDPVFGTFKVDFSAGMSTGDNSSDREVLEISRSGDDKVQIKGLFKNSNGDDVPFNWAKNWTTSGNGLQLQNGDLGKNITVMEGQTTYKGEFIVVGNEDTGKLLKVYTVTNNSEGSSNDKVTFQDYATGETTDATITTEGSGTVTIAGKAYNVIYTGTPGNGDSGTVTVIATDASTNRAVYPTINTANLNKVAFYEPLSITMSSLGGIKIPNGNGYTTVTWTVANDDVWSLSGGGLSSAAINTTKGAGLSSQVITAGPFTYNMSVSADNVTSLKIISPAGGAYSYPGVMVIEGKDDNNQYQGLLVTLTPGATSTAGLSVNTVERSWVGASTSAFKGTDPANSNLVKEADLFGAIVTLDSTINQKKALISLPKEQIYANVYVGSTGSLVSGGNTPGGSGALVAVEDSEISSVQDKNLIVVGGSCVNKAAAKILESENPICGADFTAKTNVASGQYIIKTVKSPYNDARIAVLVAGFEAVDTTTAVNTLLAGATTDVSSSQVYPISSTSA
jgi:hypothetical protein